LCYLFCKPVGPWAKGLGTLRDTGPVDGPAEGPTSAGALPRVVAIVAGVVVALVLVLSFIVLIGGYRWVPGVVDCTASVGERTVELTTGDAEQAASISARSVRRGLSVRTTSAAVADGLDISEEDARVVASGLTGRAPHAMTCLHGGADEEERDRLNRSGLTGRAATVRREIDQAFGPQRVGGFARGGVTSGHMPGSAHYEGRAVDVFFRPVTNRNRTRGWATAQYLVAHADRLSVNTVIFDGRIWTHRRATQGWREYDVDTSRRSAQVSAILEHRDHVHVDVAD